MTSHLTVNSPEITFEYLPEGFVNVLLKGISRGTFRVEKSDRVYYVAERDFGHPGYARIVGDNLNEAMEWLIPELRVIEIDG